MTMPPVQNAGQMLAYQQPTPPAVPEGWTNVKVYGYLNEKMPNHLRSQIIRQMAISGAMSVIVVLLQVRILAESPRIAMELVLFMLGIFGLSFGMRIWRLRRTIARQWPSFRIYAADQGVCRICRDLPRLVLTLGEIKEIRELKGKGLIIKGTGSRGAILVIAEYVENYAELREQLGKMSAFKGPARPWVQSTRNILLSMLYLTLLIGGYFLGMVSDDLRVQIACAAVVAVTVSVVQYIIWRSPNLPLAQKLGSLLIFIVPASLVAKVAFRLLH